MHRRATASARSLDGGVLPQHRGNSRRIPDTVAVLGTELARRKRVGYQDLAGASLQYQDMLGGETLEGCADVVRRRRKRFRLDQRSTPHTSEDLRCVTGNCAAGGFVMPQSARPSTSTRSSSSRSVSSSRAGTGKRTWEEEMTPRSLRISLRIPTPPTPSWASKRIRGR